MTTRYHELYESGVQVYRNGRYREAVLFFQQAKAEAELHGSRTLAFKAIVYLGDAWELAGEQLRALEQTLDALRAIPQDADPLDVWVAKKNLFCLTLNYRPNYEKLAKIYDTLERHFCETPGLPEADLAFLKGELSSFHCDFATALTSYEEGISLYDGDGVKGFSRYPVVYDVVDLNLRLGLRDAAARWCKFLEREEDESMHKRLIQVLAQARLARFDGDYTALESAAGGAMDLVEFMSDLSWKAAARDEMLRCRLLQPAYGAPSDPAHPARTLLCQRSPGRLGVRETYKRRLQIFDYRLACVRFATSIPAVEDEWYRTPQDLSAVRQAPCVTSTALGRLMEKARQSGRRALDYAKFLDLCFACNFYQEEVRQRLARLEAISTILAL